MCGILGQVQTDSPVDESAFPRMLQSLASRGPDGQGVKFLDGGRVALGHRRLSIIDLSEAASQPMANETHDVWLVFNGEIYNFPALRKTLESHGHEFRSRSDSEVVLHAYEEWGEDCVHRLRGIFAFGIWDQPRRRLLLARDHVGVKPLYYWSHGRGFVFASQPRAILEHPRFIRKLDLQSFQDYLAYGYVPDGQAVFAGMARLPAGHLLVWEDGRTRVQPYWEPQYRPRITDAREAAEVVRDKVREAVTLQMVSDVPLGVFLSGGVDSSTVTAVIRSKAGDGLPSFTIGFHEPEKDERKYARIAAEAFRTRPVEQVLTLDRAVELIPDFIHVYDEPFYDGSGLPTFLVSQLAREHGIKVILAGDGGDELFAGYLWYDSYVNKANVPPLARWLDRFRPASPDRALGRYFPLVGFLDRAGQAGLVNGAADYDHLAAFRRHYRPGLPDVTTVQLLDLRTYLVGDILTKVDRASMACGVEVRVPLLDHELVETALAIDSRVLFAGGERKSVLKKAVAEWVPPEILTARKKGFSIPTSAWMKSRLARAAPGLLLGGSLMSREVLRADGLRDLLARDNPFHTWLLLVAELWSRRWLDGDDLRRLAF